MSNPKSRNLTFEKGKALKSLIRKAEPSLFRKAKHLDFLSEKQNPGQRPWVQARAKALDPGLRTMARGPKARVPGSQDPGRARDIGSEAQAPGPWVRNYKKIKSKIVLWSLLYFEIDLFLIVLISNLLLVF